jgi:hypothetical protein
MRDRPRAQAQRSNFDFPHSRFMVHTNPPKRLSADYKRYDRASHAGGIRRCSLARSIVRIRRWDWATFRWKAAKSFANSRSAMSRMRHARRPAPTQILVLTAIGPMHRPDFLIGAGRPLEPERHFIIRADAIGDGLTTSPGNSMAQP